MWTLDEAACARPSVGVRLGRDETATLKRLILTRICRALGIPPGEDTLETWWRIAVALEARRPPSAE